MEVIEDGPYNEKNWAGRGFRKGFFMVHMWQNASVHLQIYHTSAHGITQAHRCICKYYALDALL